MYDVRLAGPDGFRWSVKVDRDGHVTASAPETSPTPESVQGWRGTLHALPAGSPYDDYFGVIGGMGGQYGIGAEDDSIAARLAALTNSGRVVIVWGVLRRDVPDHAQARILVTRFQVEALPPTRVAESELVDGWVGVIRALPAGSPHDDYFDTRRPGGQYGIRSLVPRIAEQLAAYRDTGTPVRVWGMLDYGVSDYGGRAIIVSRLEGSGG